MQRFSQSAVPEDTAEYGTMVNECIEPFLVSHDLKWW